MAFFSLKPTGGPLPAQLGQKGFPIKRPVIITTRNVLPLQVKSVEERKLEAPMNLGVSRRDMMIYLTAGALSGSTDPVEARVVKPEIRKKIREKLDMLREKAGLSKPKNENGTKISPEQPSAKEKKFPPFVPPVPSPSSIGPLVEATTLP